MCLTLGIERLWLLRCPAQRKGWLNSSFTRTVLRHQATAWSPLSEWHIHHQPHFSKTQTDLWGSLKIQTPKCLTTADGHLHQTNSGDYDSMSIAWCSLGVPLHQACIIFFGNAPTACSNVWRQSAVTRGHRASSRATSTLKGVLACNADKLQEAWTHSLVSVVLHCLLSSQRQDGKEMVWSHWEYQGSYSRRKKHKSIQENINFSTYNHPLASYLHAF